METFTDRNWDGEVLRSAVPVVVTFSADWCVPCRMAVPALESAEMRHRGKIRFGRVEYDESPALVQRYEIQGLPTVIVVKDGRPVERRVGLMGRAAIQEMVRKHAS
jgi:thioredoxin